MCNVIELLDLANAYCETDLKRHCINMVKQGITIDNVAFLYSTAIEYNAEVTVTAFLILHCRMQAFLSSFGYFQLALLVTSEARNSKKKMYNCCVLM